MKAVLRLAWLYFTGTTLARVISTIGFLLVAAGSAALARFGRTLLAQHGLPSQFSLAQEAGITALSLAGTLCAFFGSSLLPVVVGHLASSRLLGVLPGGRARVLGSALATTSFLAGVTGFASLFYFTAYRLNLLDVFVRTFAISFVTYSVLYVALWTISQLRSALGVLTSAMLTIAALALPARYMEATQSAIAPVAIAAVLLWMAFGTWFLFASHCAGFVARIRGSVRERLGATSYSGGDEIDWTLGTSRPWLLAIALCVPVGVAALFIADPKVWLFYLALFGAIVGGLASVAAARSRALWLRADWDRSTLFARVEAAYLRHDAFALGMLALLLVAIGSYTDLPTRTLALGVVTLVLGMLVCLYLGLMITRGVRWRETLAGVLAMALLMAAAIWAADDTTAITTIALLDAALLALAAVFRFTARRRWRALDWMLCRPDDRARATA